MLGNFHVVVVVLLIKPIAIFFYVLVSVALVGSSVP